MKILSLLLLVLLTPLVGCSRFHTLQIDQRFADGKPSTTITTKVSALTFFDAKSQLANFKASQTEKSQGASVGALSTESSGTNAVAVLDRLHKIVSALPK